jgi:hypothetical protein
LDSLQIRLVGNEWVKEWTLLRTTRNRCRDKLEESIEKPCKDVLAHRTN